jgi:hypothetical protein
MVKQVSTGTPRRVVLKAAAAAAVGGVLSMVGRHEEALAVRCVGAESRHCGSACYDPEASLCCRCGLHGKQVLENVSPGATCSFFHCQ